MAFFKGLLNGSGQGEPTRTVDFDDFSIDVGSDGKLREHCNWLLSVCCVTHHIAWFTSALDMSRILAM